MNDELCMRMIERAIAIQQIPAPTFAEAERAAFVRDAFIDEGLQDVEMDALGNVFARLPGAARQPALVLSAHTDTVFPADTDLTITRDAQRISGPGLGDNALGVAGLFAAVWMLREAGETLPGDLWLAANVGEEGLGDLVGMRAVVDRFGGDPAAYIVLEGMSYGRIFHRGLGVLRYAITASGPGGHSWVDAGRPSAIAALAALVVRLESIKLPRRPRTTLNVGVVQGGTSVNTIPAEASLQLDLRSTDPERLDALRQAVEQLVYEANTTNIRFSLEQIGARPVGELKKSHPLVRAAIEAVKASGEKPELSVGSTDANVPLSRGYPAVCIGLTTGGDAHASTEFMRVAPLASGLQQLHHVLRAAYDLPATQETSAHSLSKWKAPMTTIKYDDWRHAKAMQATLTWKGAGLQMQGTADDTHSLVELASGLDEGQPGFRPMELMGIGLAGCTAMDVLSILQKKRQDVHDFKVVVHTESAEQHPHVWTTVRIEYIVTGKDIDPAAVQRAMQLSAERYCPAQNMINKAVDIQLEYTIHPVA